MKFTLELALFLVIMVIFLFLRNLSATTIPSLALPFSLVGTFAVMYLGGYSLDNLSLMALTLSVGFVVDDAIVMLENIVRHMEHGEGVMEAAINGSGEIGFTILSMTLSLAAVFIPVLFMGGVLGRLLHEFAVTIMSAILVSGFVSLTLTPMLCSRFLKPHHEVKHGRLFNFFESMQVGLQKRIRPLPAGRASAQAGHDGGFGGSGGRHRTILPSSFRRVSCPARISIRSTGPPRRSRAFRSMPWWSTRNKSPRS